MEHSINVLERSTGDNRRKANGKGKEIIEKRGTNDEWSRRRVSKEH
jgi:hypothetical protein